MQIAIATAGLSAARLLSDKDLELPYTFLAIIFLGVSIFFGCLQFIVDYFHFVKEGKLCRDIASTSFSLLLHPTDQNISTLESDLDRKSKMKTQSNLIPLFIQVILIGTSVLLVFSELSK